MNWIEAEMQTYKNKKVKYQNNTYIVKEVFWSESTEKFTFYIEDDNRNLCKVYEKEIELIV